LVFGALFFISPVGQAFFGFVFAISSAAGIDPVLVIAGRAHMRFF